MIIPIALLASSMLSDQIVTMKLLPTGATAKTGGYRPVRAEISNAETGIRVKPADLTNASFGTFTFGDRTVRFILDEPEGKPSKIYVDGNGDGDLTNDAEPEWKSRPQGAFSLFMGGTTVDIGKGAPVGIKFYRFDPKDPDRAQLKDTILYYSDFGYEVNFALDGKKFTSFLAGEPSADSSLSADRNGDGEISYKRETISVGQPFNFTGTTYILKVDKGQLSLATSATKLPKMDLPPDLQIGKKAIPFTATNIDGKKVNFPGDYKGKLVMLDFWATWCGPCIAELPNVKAAYAKLHSAGYEVLGISFDDKDQADKVRAFAKENGMVWSHIYEGLVWDTKLGSLYDVAGIPFVLLIDGDTGKILATEKELRGPGIVATIEKALADKKKGK